MCLENGCFHRRGDVNQKVWGDHAINCCYVLSGVDLRVKLFDKGQGPQPLSRLREQIRTDLSVGFLCYRPFCMFQRQPGLIESDCLTLVRVFGNLLRQESLWEIAWVHYYSCQIGKLSVALSQFTSTHWVSLWWCAVTWERKSPQIDANFGGWISRYAICLLFLTIFAKQCCVIHKGSILFSMTFNLNLNNSFQARKVWRAKTRRHCIQGNQRENGRFHCTWHGDTSITF